MALYCIPSLHFHLHYFSLPPHLTHLQFWFHLCAAKCVYSNTWQAHWTCTGSLSELRRVTDGQHTTMVRFLMFNSDCNLFPPIQLLSPDPGLKHPGERERAVVLSWGPLCPSPSTFASVEHSIYFIAPLHLIALTSQIPWRVMRWLCWCQSPCWLGRPTNPVGIFRRGIPCKEEEKKEREYRGKGINFTRVVFRFQRAPLESCRAPVAARPLSLMGMCDWFVTDGIHRENLNTGNRLQWDDEGLTWCPGIDSKGHGQRGALSGKRSHFNLKSAVLWPGQGNTQSSFDRESPVCLRVAEQWSAHVVIPSPHRSRLPSQNC